ncbi:MFS transporter [Bacillus sp. SG-1]|uniref:MFS transporter n=1 Tax=Bacillus sp. SG-1 TaxID=161544 RepID=UPI00015443E2|nr:MFS transporter [Bacillus sp. SG-1]EDL64904.1 Probable 3-phenylpropionic acid transporter [Bacillus sp. SG-1]
MKKQSWLSNQFFVIMFTWGIFIPYWTAWLVESKGFSIATASSLVAAGMIARSFSSFYLFPTLSQRFPLGKLARILTVVSSITLILFFPISSFIGMLACMILFSLVYPMLMPLVESMAAVMMKKDNVDYGKSRSWGSLGYTSALLLAGFLTSIFSEGAIIYMMFAGVIMILLTSLQKLPASMSEPRGQEKLSYRSLLKSKKFILAMGIVIFTLGTHAAYYNYGVLYLKELNVSNIYIGVMLNIAIIAEILFFALSDKFLKGRSISIMFMTAGSAAILRWTLLFMFPSVTVFIATQLLHAFTFGLTHYAFMRLIYEELESKDLPAAQGVYTALGSGLSTAVLTFVGGFLYDYAPGYAFLGMAIVVIPAVALGGFMYAKYERKPVVQKVLH